MTESMAVGIRGSWLLVFCVAQAGQRKKVTPQCHSGSTAAGEAQCQGTDPMPRPPTEQLYRRVFIDYYIKVVCLDKTRSSHQSPLTYSMCLLKEITCVCAHTQTYTANYKYEHPCMHTSNP